MWICCVYIYYTHNTMYMRFYVCVCWTQKLGRVWHLNMFNPCTYMEQYHGAICMWIYIYIVTNMIV
jgi:hypothetical protein